MTKIKHAIIIRFSEGNCTQTLRGPSAVLQHERIFWAYLITGVQYIVMDGRFL